MSEKQQAKKSNFYDFDATSVERPTGKDAKRPEDEILKIMQQLSEAMNMINVAMIDVLSVATLCSDAKTASVSLSVLTDGIENNKLEADPLVERLYLDAQESLAALRRAAKSSHAVISHIESACRDLQRTAESLAANRTRITD